MLDVKKSKDAEAGNGGHIQSQLTFADEGEQFAKLAAEDVNDKKWRLALNWTDSKTGVSVIMHMRPQVGTKVNLNRIQMVLPGYTAH